MYAISRNRIFANLVLCYAVGLFAATLVVGTEPPSGHPPASERETVRVKSGPSTYVGHPLIQSPGNLALLRRNGRIKWFKEHEVDDLTKISPTFRPQTARELRVALQKEFGSKYEVSLTRHFVVVHPPGAYQRWALPFEQFYVRFRQWFTVRGMQLEHPEFPLVAIVLTSRGEYNRFVSKNATFHFTTAGYYSPTSNRMITYDTDNGRTKTASKTASATRETIVHEAVHQVAHNVGIHSRAFAQPLWFKEGLASAFEAPGVNNPAANPRRKDRINQYRFLKARQFLEAVKKPGLVTSLVQNDQLFRANADAGYALAWALTSYLIETQPRKFTAYVKAINNGTRGTSTDADRVKLFQASFGPVSKVEGGLRSYVAGLK